MTDAALQPCPNPWCEAGERGENFAPAIRLHHFGNYRVVCQSCSLEGPLRSTKSEAAEAWNTRLTQQPSGDVVELDRICLPPDEYDIAHVMSCSVPPCPCCQGTPTTFSRFFEHSGIYQSYVHCSRCDIQVFKNARDHDEARRLALDAWIKRPPAPDALVEALTRISQLRTSAHFNLSRSADACVRLAREIALEALSTFKDTSNVG